MLDPKSLVRTEPPLLGDEQLQKLASMERFKRIFLTSSQDGYKACALLAKYEEMAAKISERNPEIGAIPTPTEVGVVLERCEILVKNVLKAAQYRASTEATWAMFGETPRVLEPFAAIESFGNKDDRFDRAEIFRFDYQGFLESYLCSRAEFMESGERSNLQIKAFELAARKFLGDETPLIVDPISNAHITLKEIDDRFAGQDERDSARQFFSSLNYAKRTHAAAEGELPPQEESIETPGLHDKIRLKELKTLSNRLDDILAKPMFFMPEKLVERLTSWTELFNRCANELSLNTIDSERSVALSYALGNLADQHFVCSYLEAPSAEKIVDQLGQSIAFAMDFEGLDGGIRLETKYLHRALKLNRSWLIGHLGEHFLGQAFCEPRHDGLQ